MCRLLRTVAVVTAALLGTRAATIVSTAQPDPGRGAAAWMNTLTAPALTGVEPDSTPGVAVPPRSIWFADPRLHVALTAATPLPAGLLSWRHRSPRTTR